MALTTIGHSNQIDRSSVGDGSWEATLPLTNLQVSALGAVARSTDLALGSTKFVITLPSNQFVRLFAIVNHNLSLSALWRVKFSTTSDFVEGLISDTGWVDIWPQVYPIGTLPWGAPNFWSQKYSAEEAGGYTTATPILLDSSTHVGFISVEIDDTSNADGYVQIGRAFVGPAIETKIQFGATLGWESDTTAQKALSGALIFDRKTPKRVFRGSTPPMPEQTMISDIFEMQRRVGLDGEVFFMLDPDDTWQALRRQFLAHMRQLAPLSHVLPEYQSTDFEAEELIA
jgi:hypothetical protein